MNGARIEEIGGVSVSNVAEAKKLKLFVAGLITLLGLVVFGSGPAAAVIDNPDVDSSGVYEFVVDPEAGVVDVTATIAVTADKPNRYLNNGQYYQYYLEGHYVIIPVGAQDLTVTDDSGRTLDYVIEEDDSEEITVLNIDFRRNIFHRQTAVIVLSFQLRGAEARSEQLARVNEAYVGFEAWVDPALEEATMSVVVPDGFVDSSTGSNEFSLEDIEDGEDVEDGGQRFTIDDLDPEEFWMIASFNRDSALVETKLEVQGKDVIIRSWPGDTLWVEHVTDSVTDGLSVLVETVGLPWPVEELTVTESYTPYLYGYAGWYDLETDEIQIGDELDEHVAYHELSHVWFNNGLFQERWITEGLADEFAAAALAAEGGLEPEPPTTVLFDVDARPLLEWDDYVVDLDVEEWGYGASWTVTDTIVDRIGIEALSDVVVAAAANEIAYLGDARPERGRVRKDWKLYLDLIENRGEVDDDEIAVLFERWVLSSVQTPLLDDRAVSRAAYADLESSGGFWAPPVGVRTAMANWLFKKADGLIAEAAEIVEGRDALIATIEPLDASIPLQLEQAYEESEASFDDARELLEASTKTGESLRAAQQELEDATGIFQRVGAIGTDLPLQLDTAIESFEAGDLTDADDAVADLETEISSLTRAGLIRVGVVAVVLFLLLGFTLRRRMKRRAAASPAEELPKFGASSPVPRPDPVPVGAPVGGPDNPSLFPPPGASPGPAPPPNPQSETATNNN